ncbi:MAG: class I SAM-dependent methyltransferase [Firmicutes bacterium]|nr:class I SAM-dependent methyltransferase [Bacillota bacterium]
MKPIDHLTRYYTESDEDARLTSRRGRVEFLTTMRYIGKYLEKGMKVLEIGAATGRYSHALAREGYEVAAVELVRHNLDILIAKTEPGEKITATEGDATDLSFFPDGAFDMTLLLGPMYHLYTAADQKQALSEALRVTKKGGTLCVAYCVVDAPIVQHGFKAGHMLEFIESGVVDKDTFRQAMIPEELFQCCRKEDVDALMEGLPAKRLHYAATDLFTHYISEAVDAMDDETFDLYMKYHFFLCERPDMLGVTNHSLDVLRKL